MRYGIYVGTKDQSDLFHIGALYEIEDKSSVEHLFDYYIVHNGPSDGVLKEAIMLINKERYDFMKSMQDNIFDNLQVLNDNVSEHYNDYYKHKRRDNL